LLKILEFKLANLFLIKFANLLNMFYWYIIKRIYVCSKNWMELCQLGLGSSSRADVRVIFIGAARPSFWTKIIGPTRLDLLELAE